MKAIYDLSATPFFLRGSGYPEGTLFPWVVSDFSLIDAIESGIVKVPRVPVADDSMTGDQPTYRDLWLRIRDELAQERAARPRQSAGEPKLPVELQGALAQPLRQLREVLSPVGAERRSPGQRHHAAGVHRRLQQHQRLEAGLRLHRRMGKAHSPTAQPSPSAGQLALFSNDEATAAGCTARTRSWWTASNSNRAKAMSDDFKKIAAREIEEFKAEYRARFPGRDAENLTDEDLLREVMNTVGKPGKLGEHVQCVVSVSMLTEGWDANTVTHVLGVRAFGTQLLCEQVVGRALRRMSYAAQRDGHFDPEYAEVYGVPFSFIPCSGATDDPKPGPMPTRVRALDNRDRLRDHLSPPARLPLRTAGRTAHRRRSRTNPSSLSPPPTSRPRPRTRRSSANPASTPSTISSAAGSTRSPSCWPS